MVYTICKPVIAYVYIICKIYNTKLHDKTCQAIMKTKSNGLYYMEIYNSLDAELQNMSGENEDEIKYNKLFYHMEIYNSLDAA